MLPGVRRCHHSSYDNRDEYLVALRAADASLRGEVDEDAAAREPDTREITAFLKKMLTRQLASVIDRLSYPLKGNGASVGTPPPSYKTPPMLPRRQRAAAVRAFARSRDGSCERNPVASTISVAVSSMRRA